MYISKKKKERRKILLLRTTNTKSEHSDKVVTRMTVHALDGYPIQKMKSH